MCAAFEFVVLLQAAPVIFLMATQGEGDPCDNSATFYEAMNSTERDPDSLAQLRFAVFGCENMTGWRWG